MRTLSRGTTLVVVMMAVASCGDLLKKRGDDAGATAATTEPVNGTPVPTAQVLATNQGDIARYPDEKPLAAPTKYAFQRGFNVRESVPNGKVIAGLGKGVQATELAKRPPYILITFDSPSAPGTTMMGWVHQDAFSLVVADAGALTCAAGETALFSDVPTCGKVCTTDPECGANMACKGQSNLLAAGKAGNPVKVCVLAAPSPSPSPSPSPTPAVDAGNKTTPVADAAAPVVHDAAAPAPNNGDPPAGTDEVPPTSGTKCPGSFIYVDKTKHCHRPCPQGAPNCSSNPLHYCGMCDKTKKVCTNVRGVCL